MDLFEPSVELWYHKPSGEFLLYYPGDFFNTRFIMGRNEKRWIMASPYGKTKYVNRIEKNFCQLEDLK